MGIKERKEREKKQRKAQIVDAAIDLMEEQGFDTTTMDEIAERAELSKGTLYLYYADKSTLYQAIKKRALQKIHQNFSSSLQQDLPGAELVQNMLSFYADFIKDNATLTKAMMLYERSNENMPTKNPVYEKCVHLENELLILMTRAIQIGIQDKSIKTNLDPKIMALQIGVYMRGILFFYLSDSQSKGIEILENKNMSLNQLVEHFLQLQFS